MLRFLIDDGYKTRPCDLRDLEIIYHFKLDYVMYSNKRHWWLLRKKEDIQILYLLRAALRAINNLSPGHITILNYVDIYKIQCKKLHKYKRMGLIHLVLPFL